MSRTKQAIQWMQAEYGRTQQQAARLYGIKQPAISAALRRAGGGRSVQVEREACACLAEAMGAHTVAEMIRARG